MRILTFICGALAMIVAAAGCNNRVSSQRPPNLDLAGAIRTELEKGAGSATAGGPVLAEPTGWATLKGTFKVNGKPGPRKVLTVDKDQAICAPAGKVIVENDVVVGPGDGLANVLVFLSTKTPNDPKWIHEDHEAQKTAQLEFDQKNCLFVTRVLAMRSTQTLKILNSDPMLHNVSLSPKAGAKPLNAGTPGGSSVLYTPGGEEPSPFAVACGVHPWMKAWMISRNNPYFAVTKEDGSFEIANLPSGVDLEFRVWQENLQGVESVTLDGESKKWPKGKYKLKLEQDENKNINVVVDAALFK